MTGGVRPSIATPEKDSVSLQKVLSLRARLNCAGITNGGSSADTLQILIQCEAIPEDTVISLVLTAQKSASSQALQLKLTLAPYSFCYQQRTNNIDVDSVVDMRRDTSTAMELNKDIITQDELKQNQPSINEQRTNFTLAELGICEPSPHRSGYCSDMGILHQGYSLSTGSDADSDTEGGMSPEHAIRLWGRGIKSRRSSGLSSRENSALTLTDSDNENKSDDENGSKPQQTFAVDRVQFTKAKSMPATILKEKLAWAFPLRSIIC
ncbi:hypothetical protein PANDA_007146 [Ailuropoda melanoleuca]|uniref:Teneurin N-terminal domain-containing protein n=1 Tax=Ailuropoda melanoleuca TaxID=9646 RepID=D2H9V8_AILME|nr:hypothetical protein PANDA_007146 [Ailuropoda melanoleuca]